MPATRRLWSRLRSRLSQGFLLDSPAWSWVLVVGCLVRASSYWFRPPDVLTLTPASARIEGVLSYPMWVGVLLVTAALISWGTAHPSFVVTAWAGHVVGAVMVGTLAASITAAAVFDGGTWSALWPLVVVLLVHVGRANHLGQGAREAFAPRIAWLLRGGRGRGE
ncbi:MAG: hypothetical protein F2667_04380 [Actinobacteria bacterium]|uniref:Unannotated protein n=1 Tax=freshwater metagenome TaxID=449393 RepID=A0A6J6PHF2_9ZZZZ|nr:hypothetical protein [Actinomycetota bacterium]